MKTRPRPPPRGSSPLATVLVAATALAAAQDTFPAASPAAVPSELADWAAAWAVSDVEGVLDAFSYRPPYYHLDPSDEAPINFYEYGPQNSRGFRGLKVWLGLRHAGREGYTDMIGADIALARSLHQHVAMCPGLEPRTQELSITTFRYVPPDLEPGGEAVEAYLNLVNAELLTRLQAGGEVYVSNAVVGGAFLLRACVVNFRTSAADVAALPGVVVRIGTAVDAELRPRELTRAGK